MIVPWTLPAMARVEPRPAPLTPPPIIDAENAHRDGGLARPLHRGGQAASPGPKRAAAELADRLATVTACDAFGT